MDLVSSFEIDSAITVVYSLDTDVYLLIFQSLLSGASVVRRRRKRKKRLLWMLLQQVLYGLHVLLMTSRSRAFTTGVQLKLRQRWVYSIHIARLTDRDLFVSGLENGSDCLFLQIFFNKFVHSVALLFIMMLLAGIGLLRMRVNAFH